MASIDLVTIDRAATERFETDPPKSRRSKAVKVTAVPVERAPAGPDNTVSRRDLRGRKQKFEARKVRRIIRHVDPWSVLKLSLVFFLCFWVMCMVAVVIVWSIAESAGTIEKIEGFVSDLGIKGWKLNGTFVFRQYGLFGLVMVFASTIATVISTVIFNLISDLIGGIWVTVIEEETSRPVTS